MASAVAHPEALLERLDIAGSDDESSEAAERKRPAVANLGLPTSITNVAADNFLYWTLSDLIDDHPEDTKIEVPVEDELALEIAGVGLKVVKDKSNPEDEDYVPADRKTKVDTLVCLRKTLVLHEDNPVWDRTPQAEWVALVAEVGGNIDKAGVIVQGWIDAAGDSALSPRPIPGSEDVDLMAEPIYIDANRKVLFDAKPAQTERCAALIFNYLAFHERGIAALEAQEAERRAQLPGVMWRKTHPEPLRFPLPSVLAGKIDADEFPAVAAAVQRGYLEGPSELKTSRTVSAAASKLSRETLSREEKAANQLLYLINDRLLVSDKFWLQDEAEVVGTPAQLTAAYDAVVKDLKALAATDRLTHRDGDTLETELWNMVYDAEKGDYDD